ncbi:hypothetical protein BALOs_1051 [Halobacteriovorax sp. BALOs_7]|uniref:hypothetical protein n=1 Tax=Halobacteriovorax sp. BALOs_7 TaxID=2109558 RepID=UPI000EA0FACD|nr:hypothetical protein [Halobacteriovorax sp. BALOs_7]AYF44061.1 hypothetical protein BALOs_1051 [Halobacteriovorax sp. BALOs_7]
MKTVLVIIFTLILSIGVSSSTYAIDYSVSDNQDVLLDINKTINKRWRDLEELQENSDWVDTQLKLQYFGTIYQKGWFGPKVQRQIMPSLDGKYIVVDSISVGVPILKQMAYLGTNFLIRSSLPFIQGTPTEERHFSKATAVDSYEEAIELKHMEVIDLPTSRERFNSLRVGQQVNTVLTSGFASRVNLLWLDFLNVVIPEVTTFAPKAKLKISKSLDVTIEKEQNDIAVITIKHLDDMSKGAGLGLSLIVDEIIDLPISIGINESQGYSPIVFNLKKSKQEINQLIYRLDLSTPEGLKAYLSFLDQDFSEIQDLEESGNDSVELFMKKEGQRNNSEFNWGLNFVLWKTGARYISENGKYETRFKDGENLKYEEIIYSKVSDHKGFSGKEKRNYNLKAVVPTNDNATKSFSLTINYSYSDDDSSGRELNKEADFLYERYLDNGMRIDFDKNQDYGKVQIYSSLIFSTKAIEELIEVDDFTLWESIALAFEYTDSLIWISEEDRNDFRRDNYVYEHSVRKRNHLSANQKKKLKQLENLKLAQRVYKLFDKLRSNISVKEKAKLLVHGLKSSKLAPVVQKAMVNIIGINDLMGQGYIKGNLY